MARGAEIIRTIVGKKEVGLPAFSQEKRQEILQNARSFVTEVKSVAPEAGVDERVFRHWLPQPKDFAQPVAIGINPHAHHNISHIGSVLAEEMFLVPYVDTIYANNLGRQLFPHAVYASAAGHDLLRGFDVIEAIHPSLYALHGKRMAEEVRAGKRFPELDSLERTVAAISIQYHDVDPRLLAARNPEDELLAIVDRGDLARLTYGVGPVARVIGKGGELFKGENSYEKQRKNYTSHYFPGLAEKIQPLSQAMLILRLEGMRSGLSQEDAIVYAAKELGMTKNAQQTQDEEQQIKAA